LVSAVVRQLVRHRRIKDALFVYVPDLIHRLSYQRGFDERDAVIQQAINVDLLVLDDLGATRIGDFERDHLTLILHQRNANNRSFFVTTNEDPSQSRLMELVGQRIVSRLRRAMSLIITGPDHRMEDK
jgi:DNA replication protein DnaC